MLFLFNQGIIRPPVPLNMYETCWKCQHLDIRWCDLFVFSTPQLEDSTFAQCHLTFSKPPKLQTIHRWSRATDAAYHDNVVVCKASEKLWALSSQGNTDASLIISFPFITVCHLYLFRVSVFMLSHVRMMDEVVAVYTSSFLGSIAVVFIISKHTGTAPYM